MSDTARREQATRDRILCAAEEQFRRFGPKKTSMEDIARLAGLSRATLYLHFSGKSSVYEAIRQGVRQQYVERLHELVESDRQAPRKLRLFVELTLETYSNHPVFLAALTGDQEYSIQTVAGPIMATSRSEILDPLRKILEQGIRELTIRKLNVNETAYLMYELGNQLLKKELSGEAEHPLNEILNTMDDIVARGILIDP